MKKLALGLSLVVAAAMLASLVACAGETAKVKQEIKEDPSSYKVLAFSAESKVAEDMTKELSDLTSRVVQEVTERKLFQSVVAGNGRGSQAKALHAHATIIDVHKVSGGERFWAGAFAGKAHIQANVVFKNAATGKVLGEWFVEGKSGSTGVSGGTGSAIAHFAEAFADKLEERIKGKK